MDADDLQVIRNGFREMAATLKLYYDAMVEVGLPEAIVVPLVTQWAYQAIAQSNAQNQTDLFEQMVKTMKRMLPDEEDE